MAAACTAEAGCEVAYGCHDAVLWPTGRFYAVSIQTGPNAAKGTKEVVITTVRELTLKLPGYELNII